jgi:hypothetical protein
MHSTPELFSRRNIAKVRELLLVALAICGLGRLQSEKSEETVVS